MGCSKIIAFGSAGVLDSTCKFGSVFIPERALRDEGVSYHYAPPERVIEMSPEVVSRLENVLRHHQISYLKGMTWTTDAFYRETKNKISRRKAEGCFTVDMECSAMIALCKFRQVSFGQYLVVSDDISGSEWNPRIAERDAIIEEKVFWLSVEACLSL